MNIGKSGLKARVIYVLIYIFGLVGGILGYIFGHGRTKTHAKQAIILWVISVILSLIIGAITFTTLGWGSLISFSTNIGSIAGILGIIGIILGIFDITFLKDERNYKK
jgi:uncharacterized membrane protein